MSIEDIKDKDDPYVPIRFSRNYQDKPVEVRPYWIHFVEATNFLGYGDFRMDVLGKPALTGPNGFGKTVILKMIAAIMDLISGKCPTVLYQVLRDSDKEGVVQYSRLFDSFSVTTVEGREYSLVVSDFSTGLYNLLVDGEFFMEVSDTGSVVPDAFEDVDPVWIPAGRIGSPASYIMKFISMSGGNIDYEFLDKWYNWLIQGNTDDSHASVHRYSGLPYSTVTSVKKAHSVLDSIMKWIEARHLSHGEIELLILLLALKSGSKLVVVDDIEVGLHVSVQVEIMRVLTCMYNDGVQVLYSTNSPSTFDGVFGYSNDLYGLFFPEKDD